MLDPRHDPLAGAWRGESAQSGAGTGTEGAMRAKPDHGEQSYVGHGRLAGRKALVTGGDSGIGKAIALAFAREGADVAIGYLDEHDDARATLAWIEKAGRKGVAFAGDLSEPETPGRLVDQAAEALGGLDILVNNAACQFPIGDIGELTYEHLDRTFKTNLYATVLASQAALRHMGPGGVILMTGSVAGMHGHDALPDYAATKGAIHNFTKSLAMMVAPRGIRVNCVAPGPVWTPMVAATLPPEVVANFGADSMWGRPAQPVEIARSFVFLASAESIYTTGEILGATGMHITTR